MALKFVYTLVSSERDYYAEQAAVSMHSLRLHNPECHITLVTDEDTLKSLTGCRSLIKKYVSECITVNPPADFTPVQKSRYIKTSLRQNIKGDFLFIDCDTIVTGCLEACGEMYAELGAVLDCHTTAERNGQLNRYLEQTKKTFWGYNFYFNTGVLLVKDTENTHKFFDDWHRIWLEDKAKYNTSMDQPSFAQADMANNHLVREIDGRYNCQIVMAGAKRLMFDSLVVHYMSNLPEVGFPLKETNVLKQVREKGITEDISRIIRNPQMSFLESSCIIGGKELELYNSPMVILGRKLSRDFAWTNSIAKFIYRLFGFKI